MVSDAGPTRRGRIGRRLSALAALAAAAAAAVLLSPDPLADVFFAAWVLFAVAVAAAGWVGARRGRPAVVWLAALLLPGLVVAGM